MENDIDREKIAGCDPETGYVQLNTTFPDSKTLWNEDFQPTPVANRTWGGMDIFCYLVWHGSGS